MERKIIFESQEIEKFFKRLASEIVKKHGTTSPLMLVGIQRRGVDIANRMQALLLESLKCEIPVATLDINLYRDDWTSLLNQPNIGKTFFPIKVEEVNIILIDDVLYTGRTIRAALEAILDYGRPKCVELLVMIDRGHRELPIHADYIGAKIETTRLQQVNVLLKERDNIDQIQLIMS